MAQGVAKVAIVRCVTAVVVGAGVVVGVGAGLGEGAGVPPLPPPPQLDSTSASASGAVLAMPIIADDLPTRETRRPQRF
jgi:hypothetical protein